MGAGERSDVGVAWAVGVSGVSGVPSVGRGVCPGPGLGALVGVGIPAVGPAVGVGPGTSVKVGVGPSPGVMVVGGIPVAPFSMEASPAVGVSGAVLVPSVRVARGNPPPGVGVATGVGVRVGRRISPWSGSGVGRATGREGVSRDAVSGEGWGMGVRVGEDVAPPPHARAAASSRARLATTYLIGPLGPLGSTWCQCLSLVQALGLPEGPLKSRGSLGRRGPSGCGGDTGAPPPPGWKRR